MPKRFSSNMRLWIYRYLVARDGGDYCRICGKTPKRLFSLDIDHIDNNHKNDNEDNLQLAHRKCNQKKEIEFRSQRGKQVTNVSIEGSPSTRIVRDHVDYTQGSAEMKANSFFEVTFRKWLLKEIGRTDGIEKKEAVSSGAELVGCSTATINRYIEKLVSSIGPLQEVSDFMGIKLLVFKDDIQKVLTSLSRAKAEKKTSPAQKPVKKPKKTKASKDPGPGSGE